MTTPARRALEIVSEFDLGCVNHGCVWGQRPGMGANSICKCLADVQRALGTKRRVQLERGIRALSRAVDREEPER